MSPETQQIINLLTEIRDLLKARPATGPAPQAQNGTDTGRNSYAKLKDGSWGVRCLSAVNPGDSVTVFTKDNKKRTETINQVVYRGADRNSGKPVWVCSVIPHSKGSSAPADAPAAAAQAGSEAAAAQEEDDVPF